MKTKEDIFKYTLSLIMKKTIINNTNNFSINKYTIEPVNLTENYTKEIIGVIKAFINNLLLTIFREKRLERFYNNLHHNINNEIENIRTNQWNHCILELDKKIN